MKRAIESCFFFLAILNRKLRIYKVTLYALQYYCVPSNVYNFYINAYF